MIELGSPSRRRLLQIGAIGFSGLTLPRALRGGTPTVRAKSCLLIYLDGGPSHIDLFDLKPDAPDEIRGPYRPISTSAPGIQIGELLPNVARQMHHVALLRSVCHEETVHDPAVYQMLTGFKHVSSAGGLTVEDTDLPHIASAFCAADRSVAVMPKAIELPETMKMDARVLPGQNSGILGATFDSLHVEVSPAGEVIKPDFGSHADVSRPRLAGRVALLEQFNQHISRLRQTRTVERFDTFQQQALDILAASQIEQAFDLEREPANLRDRYGRHRHGQSALLARRLIEAGARFVTVYWGREPQDWADGKGSRPANNPWDTHRNHFPLVKDSLLPRADQTLASLLDDLHDRGLLKETLVVWMGDFGRTPRISKPWASRDHWPHAFSMILAGGGIRGGTVHGATDGHASFVTDSPVTPADITATLFHALGVAPHTVVRDASGRPHRISRGTPLLELFS